MNLTELEVAKAILVYNDLIDTKIYQIIKTGSQTFKTDPTDLDYVVVCDKVPDGRMRRTKKHSGKNYDMIFIQPENIEKMYRFEYIFGISKFNYYFTESLKQTIYDTNEIVIPPFDMFKEGVEEIYMVNLKNELDIIIERTIDRYYGFKKWYIYTYIILKMYQNKNTLITEEMKEDIENIYNQTNNFPEVCEHIEELINAYNEDLLIAEE